MTRLAPDSPMIDPLQLWVRHNSITDRFDVLINYEKPEIGARRWSSEPWPEASCNTEAEVLAWIAGFESGWGWQSI